MPTLTTTKWTPVETGYEVSDIVVPATPRTYLTLCLRDKERFHVNRPKLAEQFGRYVPKRNGGRLARVLLESVSLPQAQKATPVSSLMRRALGLEKATHDTFNRALFERGVAMSVMQAEWVFDQETRPTREELSKTVRFVVTSEDEDILVLSFSLYSPDDTRPTPVGAYDLHSYGTLDYSSSKALYFLVP